MWERRPRELRRCECKCPRSRPPAGGGRAQGGEELAPARPQALSLLHCASVSPSARRGSSRSESQPGSQVLSMGESLEHGRRWLLCRCHHHCGGLALLLSQRGPCAARGPSCPVWPRAKPPCYRLARGGQGGSWDRMRVQAPLDVSTLSSPCRPSQPGAPHTHPPRGSQAGPAGVAQPVREVAHYGPQAQSLVTPPPTSSLRPQNPRATPPLCPSRGVRPPSHTRL